MRHPLNIPYLTCSKKSKKQIDRIVKGAHKFNVNREKWLEKYKTSVSKTIIGEGSVSPELAIGFASQHLKEAIDLAQKFVNNFNSLSKTRQLVLIDMAYNLGPNLNGFKKFKANIERLNFELAAKEMVSSAWYGQVKSRSKRLVKAFVNDKHKIRYHAIPKELVKIFKSKDFNKEIRAELEWRMVQSKWSQPGSKQNSIKSNSNLSKQSKTREKEHVDYDRPFMSNEKDKPTAVDRPTPADRPSRDTEGISIDREGPIKDNIGDRGPAGGK